MNRQQAEIIGLQALGWLSAHPDLSGVLLNMTGLTGAELAARASDAEFQGFVLDFLLENEPALLDFSAEFGLQNDAVFRARTALPGGEVPNWT